MLVLSLCMCSFVIIIFSMIVHFWISCRFDFYSGAACKEEIWGDVKCAYTNYMYWNWFWYVVYLKCIWTSLRWVHLVNSLNQTLIMLKIYSLVQCVWDHIRSNILHFYACINLNMSWDLLVCFEMKTVDMVWSLLAQNWSVIDKFRRSVSENFFHEKVISIQYIHF